MQCSALGGLKMALKLNFWFIHIRNSYVPSFQQKLIIIRYSCRRCQRIYFVVLQSRSLVVTTRISHNYQVLSDDGNRIIIPHGNFKFCKNKSTHQSTTASDVLPLIPPNTVEYLGRKILPNTQRAFTRQCPLLTKRCENNKTDFGWWVLSKLSNIAWRILARG